MKGGKLSKETRRKYHSIFEGMNMFVVKLDRKPQDWGDKMNLYLAYLSEVKKLQSNTLKSYISAIKQILIIEGYEINKDRVVLDSIIKTTKARNDKLLPRMPIGYHRLNTLLNHIETYFDTQPYLSALYRAMYASAYHGLLRVGEVTLGKHVIKAKDVHIGENKRKVQLVLWTSKTHTRAHPPQLNILLYLPYH